MAEAQGQHVRPYLEHVGRLLDEGRALLEAFDSVSADPTAAPEARLLRTFHTWQMGCGQLVGQLSGGSKAHWLSRAYNQALLVTPDPPATAPRPVGRPAPPSEVAPRQLVERLLEVLQKARLSLQQLAESHVSSAAMQAVGAQRRHFDFVNDRALQRNLEEAYEERQRALLQGQFALALVLACSVLEAIVTDALRHRASLSQAAVTALPRWSLERRLTAAEDARLISHGWSRLPPAALAYQSLLDPQGDLRPDASATERDARVASQVLAVIMKDLAPGR